MFTTLVPLYHFFPTYSHYYSYFLFLHLSSHVLVLNHIFFFLSSHVPNIIQTFFFFSYISFPYLQFLLLISHVAVCMYFTLAHSLLINAYHIFIFLITYYHLFTYCIFLTFPLKVLSSSPLVHRLALLFILTRIFFTFLPILAVYVPYI
jgi:hypothetical protein